MSIADKCADAGAEAAKVHAKARAAQVVRAACLSAALDGSSVHKATLAIGESLSEAVKKLDVSAMDLCVALVCNAEAILLTRGTNHAVAREILVQLVTEILP